MYMIYCEALNAFKIGISRNPMRRLSVLQVAIPSQLVLAHVWPDAGAMEEKRVHEGLREYHIVGEWFTRSEGSCERLESLVQGLRFEDVFRKCMSVEAADAEKADAEALRAHLEHIDEYYYSGG